MAEGAWLDCLEKEAEFLRANRVAVAAAISYSEEFLEFRLLNLLEAVRCARLVEEGRGGVCIA